MQYKKSIVCYFLFVSFFLSWNVLASGMPVPKWPEKISPFCKSFLNNCFRSCFQIQNKKEKNPTFQKVRQIADICYRACWNNPHRKKLCKMSQNQLLEDSETLVKQLEKEVLQEKESIEKEKNLDQETKKKEQQKKLALLEQQKKMKQESKEELERIQQEKKQLLALKKELDGLKNKQTEQKKLQEEWKRIELQKKLLKEEQERLQLQKKVALNKKLQHIQSQKELKTTLSKLEKLRAERLKEIEVLNQQKIEENKRLGELKSLVTQEDELAKQRKEIEAKKTQAQQESKVHEISNLQKELQQLQQKLKLVNNKKNQIKQKRAKSKKKRKIQLSKLRRLKKKSDRIRKAKKKKQAPPYLLAYWDGDFTLAQKKAIGRFAKLRKPLQQFSISFQKGKKYHQEREPNYALPRLERSLTLDLLISQGKGKLRTIIRKMLADMYVLKGILSMSSKNYSTAYLYFSRGKRHNAKDKVIHQNLKNLAEHALQFFKMGQSVEKTNPLESKSYYRKALSCIHPKSKLAIQIAPRIN